MCSSMAEDETEAYPKPQKSVQEQNHENPSKFYNHFLYKVALVVIFFVILPLFPSQAPEFFNQSVLTRSWEFLHLLLVGIAVSYGLFSRRNENENENENEKTDKENNSAKFDNAHSYVSGFLQVSPVFDEETETSNGSDENKVQTWSSQYYRNEPEVVVAREHSVYDEKSKPLRLPIRSLKQRVSDESFDESTRFSKKLNKSEGLDHQEMEQKLKESVVLPSPIPWRSRSARFDRKADEIDNITPPPLSSRSNSMSSSSSTCSSPKKPSPSPSLLSPKKASPLTSLSSESQAKNAEDLGRKKSFYKSCPPPPPPPPPMLYKSSSLRPGKDDGISSESKQRSYVDGLSMGRSVRTSRAGEDYLVEKVKRVAFDANSGHSDEISEEEKEDFLDTVVVESDEETESEDDNFGEPNPNPSPKNSGNSGGVSDGGPDVDKKADEFIAKFREQIRLQRINSIKRSSAEISRKLSR